MTMGGYSSTLVPSVVTPIVDVGGRVAKAEPRTMTGEVSVSIHSRLAFGSPVRVLHQGPSFHTTK